MTKLLARMSRQISTTTPTPAETRHEEFANAVAAFRKATGKPETRTIPCRCAVTGRAFDIVFERLSPAQRFQITRIEQDDGDSDRGNAGGGRSRRKLQPKSYDAAEFDWAGHICPHCGNHSGLVYCGECQETVCAGRVRPLPDGSKSFACHDGCGATGTTEPSSHVHAAGVSRLASGHAPQLRLPAAQRLPGGTAPRLPRRQPK
jgi:hypothetical protein